MIFPQNRATCHDPIFLLTSGASGTDFEPGAGGKWMYSTTWHSRCWLKCGLYVFVCVFVKRCQMCNYMHRFINCIHNTYMLCIFCTSDIYTYMHICVFVFLLLCLFCCFALMVEPQRPLDISARPEAIQKRPGGQTTTQQSHQLAPQSSTPVEAIRACWRVKIGKDNARKQKRNS